MQKRRLDLLANVLFPLLLGTSFYILPVCKIASNHLADGCWSYAFTSAILILWEREMNKTWLLITCFCFLLFEWLQHMKIVSGTGDIVDVVFYFLFSAIALLTNKFFKHKLVPQ